MGLENSDAFYERQEMQYVKLWIKLDTNIPYYKLTQIEIITALVEHKYYKAIMEPSHLHYVKMHSEDSTRDQFNKDYEDH
ncbi:hypothetical protein ACTXT7_005541 [Hymenolepis weldensis]